MARPVDLPDYSAPPLTEVAISLQFDALSNYSAVWAGPIWQTFRSDFPRVQEQMPLVPNFETFGGPAASAFNFGLVGSPLQPRLWFLNDTETELLQFQSDRFGHNWRKIPPLDNAYPRFENMIAQFERNFTKLSEFCSGNRLGNIVINQCELTYVNFVEVSRLSEAGLTPSALFSNLSFSENPEQFQLNFSIDLRDGDRPYGRIHAHCALVVRPIDQVEGVAITLTGRGAPAGSDLQSSLARLVEFRERIVRHFDALTTEAAHIFWGRV